MNTTRSIALLVILSAALMTLTGAAPAEKRKNPQIPSGCRFTMRLTPEADGRYDYTIENLVALDEIVLVSDSDKYFSDSVAANTVEWVFGRGSFGPVINDTIYNQHTIYIYKSGAGETLDCIVDIKFAGGEYATGLTAITIKPERKVAQVFSHDSVEHITMFDLSVYKEMFEFSNFSDD